MHIDRPRFHEDIVGPGSLEERFPRENLAGRAHQMAKKAKFQRTDTDAAPIAIDALGSRIEFDIGEDEGGCSR